jgi:AcrR family transcriptional regulator
VDEVVKGGLRAEHAALTRARILDAGRAVFEERGFAGARITDIASRAGVAVPTVYKVFTNKRSLLAQAVERAMTGAEYGGRVDEQAWWQEQLNEPEPVRQLALIARNARRILEAVRAAAVLDPEIAALWRSITDQRANRSRQTAGKLVERAKGRARFAVEETTASLHFLSAPELYTAHLEAGRTPAQYEHWLRAVLTATVLR